MTFLVRNLTLPVALPKETTSLEIPAPTSINLVPSGVHINGLPVVALPKERLTDVDVPSAFTVKSDIKLFGIFDTTRYSFYGTKEEGVRESIPLGKGKISISDILPSFKDTIIDDWVLESTKFKYNEYDSKLELAGTWFETLLTFGHKLEVINDVLKNVFQQESPAVYIQAFLSPRHDWSKPFLPPALCLRGSLPGGNIQVTDKILLANTSISISIGYSSQTTPDRPWGEDTVLWALGFSASAIFTISEMNKISMDFSLSYFDSLLQLELHSSKSSVLADFAGIHGLTLSSFYLSSAISTSESPSILSFSAKATLEVRDTTLQLDGLYSNKEDWTVACELDDLDIDGLCNLYEDVFGQELHLPGQDVEITKIDFIITNKGISLSAAVRIGDHTSAEGSLTFDALGVHINGKIDGNLISINNDIHLVDPKFEVFIGRQTDTDVAKPGTSWRFAISGTVTTTVGDIPALKQGIEASLYLGKDTTGKYQWMVYGSFAAGFRVSDIVSALKDNEVLDLAVDNAKFIASSISNPPLAVDAVPVAFTIMEGVQVAATLSPIDEFDKTMKNTTPSTMVLQAGYNTETSAFRIGFDLVTQQQFSAKSGSVYSDPVHPLSIYVDIGGIPTLTVDARFLVKVSKQPDLPFRGGIKISPKGAEMYVQLEPEHTWKNPFDISEQLVLGPQVALDPGIDFEAPIWPSRLQAVAELAVGTVSGKAAMGISESPDEELLILKVERLKISDLITFASMIFDQKIPAVDDFLEFKTFDLYLSGGTNIGTIVYPLGARFACDAVVFGKEATLEVSVLKQQKAITVRGSLDPVQFGPLTITGAIPDTKPEIEIALGATKQRFYINGACSILGLSGSLYLDARILGDDGKDPGIDLNVKIAFTDHMTFRLQASTPSEVKRLSLSSVDQLQFDVDCYFHQDILEYIIEHVHKQIESAKASAQKGIDSAVHDLDVAEAKYQKDLDDAMTTMEEKRKLFDIEMAKAEQRFDEGVKRLKDTEEQLLGDWKIANEKFRLLCEGAKQFLQAVKQQQVEAIGKAKQDISDAKREATNKIDAHLKELQQARNNMKRDFADAVGKLESARQDVKAARYEADDALTKLIKAQKDLEDCHWYEALYYAEEVTRHSIVCAACEAAYQIADGVLLNCEYVLENPLYKAAEASIDLYEKKLREAERDAEKTLDGLNSTLATVEADEQKKVDEASEKLDAARTRNRELFESENARKALDAAREAAERELSDLKATFDAVSKCVEAVAFDVASAAVQTARGLTAGIDIARSTLHDAEIATGAILDLGDYLVNRALGVLDIRNVHITGHLEGLCNRSSKLTAHLDGTVASEDFSTDLEFTPGQGDELIKAVFRAILDRVDNMSIDFPQRPGVLTPLPDSPPDVSPYHPDEWVFVPRTPQQETRRLLQMIKDDVGTERRWLSEYLERHETDVSAREMWARVNAVVPKIHLAMQNGTTWPENVIQAVNHSRFRQPWLGREKEWALFYIDGIESLL